VRKESCAEVALEWGVQAFVRLGDSGEADRAAKTAIPRRYLRINHRRGFPRRRLCDGQGHREGRLRGAHALAEAAVARSEDGPAGMGPGAWLPTPVYRETARSGPDHAPEFKIAVEVLGYEPAEAKGFAKRVAERLRPPTLSRARESTKAAIRASREHGN